MGFFGDIIEASKTKAYNPTTKAELQKLIKNESIKLSDISVKKVDDLSELFYMDEDGNEIHRKDFSGIETWWNFTATNLSAMFKNCRTFNEKIDNWTMSKVTDLSSIFEGCVSFNQPLNKWFIQDAENLSSMFKGCVSFNQPLNSWNVKNATDLSHMFEDCKSFNQPLEKWAVGSVINTESMFCNCYAFNQSLQKWAAGNVEKREKQRNMAMTVFGILLSIVFGILPMING